jgi:hypothetical protein
MNETSAGAKLKTDVKPSAITNLTTSGSVKLDDAIELGPYEWVVLELKK